MAAALILGAAGGSAAEINAAAGARRVVHCVSAAHDRVTIIMNDHLPSGIYQNCLHASFVAGGRKRGRICVPNGGYVEHLPDGGTRIIEQFPETTRPVRIDQFSGGAYSLFFSSGMMGTRGLRPDWSFAVNRRTRIATLTRGVEVSRETYTCSSTR